MASEVPVKLEVLGVPDQQPPCWDVGVATEMGLVLAPWSAEVPLYPQAWAQGTLKPDQLQEVLKVTAQLKADCRADQDAKEGKRGQHLNQKLKPTVAPSPPHSLK